MRNKKDRPEEVQPEVYMVSDQAQALEKDNIFAESDRRRFMKVRESKDERDILPAIISQGKAVTEFEPDFLIVNIAHGHSPNSNYSIVKMSDFPVENRSTEQRPSDVKSYLQKYKAKQFYIKYSDFHLLIYLMKLLDKDSILTLAQAIGEEQAPSELIEEIIKSTVGL